MIRNEVSLGGGPVARAGTIARPRATVPFLATLERALARLRGAITIDDPPESWELTARTVDWRYWGSAGATAHPFTPRDARDVPAGAFEALREACGAEEVDDLFVVPKNVRKAFWPRSETVVSPTHVLGVGESGAGLWVGEPRFTVEEVIGYESLCAIELKSILLYGRLRFIGKEGALTVRFNTVAEPQINALIFRVRQRIASRPFPVPPGEVPDGLQLPYKWNLIARSEFLALRDEAPRAVAFVRSRFGGRGRTRHGNLLALTPYELVYLHEPYNSNENYGTDGFYLPRPLIDGLRFDEERIACVVGGKRMEILMPAPLVEAACRWFESVVE